MQQTVDPVKVLLTTNQYTVSVSAALTTTQAANTVEGNSYEIKPSPLTLLHKAGLGESVERPPSPNSITKCLNTPNKQGQ